MLGAVVNFSHESDRQTQTNRTLARDTGRRGHRDTETERVYTKLSCGDSARRKGVWRGGALENGRQEQLIVSVCVIV